jgi:hypothetical protein
MPQDQGTEEIIVNFASKSGLSAGPSQVVSDQLRDLANTHCPADTAQKAYDLMMDNKSNPAVGTATCAILLARGDGSGMQVATEVAKQVVQSRLSTEGVRAEGDFVRSGESINGFSKELIQQTSPNLESDVKQSVLALSMQVEPEIQAYTAKAKVHLDAINAIQPRINDLSPLVQTGTPEEKAAHQGEYDSLCAEKVGYEAQIAELAPEREAIQIRVATLMHGTLTDLPLSKESLSYLNSLREAVETTQGFKETYMASKEVDEQRAIRALNTIADNLVNNNTSLRVTSPAMITDERLGKNKLWIDSAQTALTSFNRYQDSSLLATVRTPQSVADAVHVQATRQATQSMHDRVINTPKLDSLNVDLKGPSALNREQRKTDFQTAVTNVEMAANARHSVRDMIKGAVSTVRGNISERLEQKGSEQKLGDVPDHIKEEYKAEQMQLSALQSKILDNMDPAKMNGESPAKLAELQEQVAKVQTKMEHMKEDNPGLKQMDRSKVGQVVHSGLRDAAKSVGSRLKA